MELFKIHFNKPDNSKTVVKSHVCVKTDCLQSCQGKQGLYVACVQAPTLLSTNRRMGVCNSPLLIVCGAQMIFAGICEK